MASFKLIRELLSTERDKGSKRILLALYSASDSDDDIGKRYVACSEQHRDSPDSDWISSRKGITIRKSEVSAVIAALQSADFDAKPDNKHLSTQEYAKTLNW